MERYQHFFVHTESLYVIFKARKRNIKAFFKYINNIFTFYSLTTPVEGTVMLVRKSKTPRA